jgi:hypothetical protein
MVWLFVVALVLGIAVTTVLVFWMLHEMRHPMIGPLPHREPCNCGWPDYENQLDPLYDDKYMGPDCYPARETIK